MAIEPDGQNINFCIDWGDSTNEEFIGPFNSGEEITAMHSWAEEGTYIIRVKSIDIYNLESEWATFEVSMPKTKSLNVFNPWLLRLIQRFPILELLI